MATIHTITPCLWFDDQAEQAAAQYTSIFPNSRILDTQRYTDVGREHHGREPGSVMTVNFELDGQPFTALNGGPLFKINEAISFQIRCQGQEEVDHFWDRLADGGSEQPCGWLKDRFGVSWQVIPAEFEALAGGPDPEGVRRVMAAMFQMRKLDIAALKRAADGDS
ncbi:MAG: VOC family protein [Pseudomonadales bacterium]|jgi:predicted 3-demethylubiquinone-9 3-methyltransferase (glyoxalase superfamily)